MMMFASLVFRLVVLFIVNTKRKVSVSRVSRVVMFAYLSTVEHGLVDSAIRNRSSRRFSVTVLRAVPMPLVQSYHYVFFDWP